MVTFKLDNGYTLEVVRAPDNPDGDVYLTRYRHPNGTAGGFKPASYTVAALLRALGV